MVSGRVDYPNPRIALFMPSLAGGGVQRVMLNLAGGLAERGLDVDLVLARAEGPYLEPIRSGFNVVDLRSRNVSSCMPHLARYLRSKKPDAVISASSHANVATVLTRMFARSKSRIVLTEHNSTKDFMREMAENYSTWRTRLLPSVMKRTYHLADSIVAVSHGLADDLANSLQCDRSTIDVIYNPVVTPALLAKAVEPLDHPWFQPSQPPVILAVGSLEPRKGFFTLVRAFARVRQVRPVRLVILGEGPDREPLKLLARSFGIDQDLDLPGFVENPYKYMKRARLFVLSSRSEGLPTVLIEAMAVGTQVVSTDCPSGPNEILEGGKWGTLVRIENDEQMAAAICDVIDGRARYGVEKRARAFSLDNIVNSYLDVALPNRTTGASRIDCSKRAAQFAN
jgi:glycosyltransferase involved in cell wall biosynthesis